MDSILLKMEEIKCRKTDTSAEFVDMLLRIVSSTSSSSKLLLYSRIGRAKFIFPHLA